jgi:hypothetical protein
LFVSGVHCSCDILCKAIAKFYYQLGIRRV